MAINILETKDLPPALPLRKLLGPSFIILGLGLGSGEIILWPYLSSKFGLGIIWGALLGITFQFFMNMEIERYALVRGESIFVGLARKLKFIPMWFLLSTFVPWIWPGIAASSAKLLGTLFGVQDTNFLAVALLILIGIILSVGPILYKTVESFQKILIGIGVPSIFFLAIILAQKHDWIALARGSVGLGNGFNFLPIGLPVATFLAALAYAGAGGNLNLAQSLYIREKGYGMGKYAGKIKGLLTGTNEKVNLSGAKFELTKQNITEFKKWWKNINLEHFIIFWLIGSITIVLLSLLAYITLNNSSVIEPNINFVIKEAEVIGQKLIPILGTFFLLIAGLTLLGTQLTVFDATSRILSENLILAAPNHLAEKKIPKIYYSVLWLQIAAGAAILLLGVHEPLQLIIISAVLNAFAMFVHVGLTLWLNLTSLEKVLKPSMYRVAAMAGAFLFYGGFSVYTILAQIK